MKLILSSLVMVMFLLVSGCTPLLTAKEAQSMTPDQIKAYGEQGMDVYQCLNVSGPPPTGGFTFVIVPRGTRFEVAFASNCNLLTGKVTPQ